MSVPRAKQLSPVGDVEQLCCDVGWVVGLDEVGAGCLSGPLCVSAFAFQVHKSSEIEVPVRVADSKKLAPEKRAAAYEVLGRLPYCEHRFLWIDVAEIEKVNIYWARMKAFWTLILELDQLFASNAHFVVDGPKLAMKSGVTPSLGFTQKNITQRITAQSKADSNYFCVAAASILAKVSRDSFIEGLSKDFPIYNWEKNKGYATPDHIEAIKNNGLCEHHRKSFCKNFVSEVAEVRV